MKRFRLPMSAHDSSEIFPKQQAPRCPFLLRYWARHVPPVNWFVCLDLSRQLGRKDFRVTKLLFYESLIIPMLFYGAKPLTLLRTHAAVLKLLKRNILRMFFDPLEPTMSFTNSLATWTLSNYLIFSASVCSNMSFG